MNMRYGARRETSPLSKLAMEHPIRARINQIELHSDDSINKELFSIAREDGAQNSSFGHLAHDESPRVSVVQFTEPLIKGSKKSPGKHTKAVDGGPTQGATTAASKRSQKSTQN